MYKAREKILWFSVSSRIAVIFLQFVFNSACPDHNADAFRTPRDPAEEISIYDKAVATLLGGLTRWDAQYFIHIAKYGYTYENSLAFFPLYPFAVRCVAGGLARILFMLNEHSVIIIAAVLLNFLCFVKSAVIFYDLSERVLGSRRMAYKAAVLYCINPASVFFSAAYSESMFAYLTFYSMLASLENRRFVFLPIGLSTVVRSNGLVNIGFPIYAWLHSWIFLVYPKIAEEYKNHSVEKALALGLRRTLLSLIDILNTIFLSLVPFVFFQIYVYVVFCTEYSREILVPEHVALFATESDFPMPGNDSLTWCKENLPIAYSRIQAKYWNVGFVKYYQFKQIPNFVIALPVLYVMLKCVSEYFAEPKRPLRYFMSGKEGSEVARFTRLPVQIFVFVVHGLFLTLFSILFVHIQVSTRLLASASPLLYWYCASLMSYNTNDKKSNNHYEERDNAGSRWKVFFMNQKEYTLRDLVVLTYFVGYTILGCFMYSNFLPWT